jgi:SAM-dependent methyltransferase
MYAARIWQNAPKSARATQMTIKIPSGIPTTDDYQAVTGSGLFRDMETYSGEFLAAHPVVQASYGWVADPLHQWSRQYEYPFVLQRILDELQRRNGASVDVLDAGSGATFFPYQLESVLPGGSITCCDYDASLAPIFDAVNRERESAVRFEQADLRKLPFDEASFDIVYCISVLEHTNSYGEIAREFHRVLRPGGLLVATYDIGLDGVSEISPREARALNESVVATFGNSDLADGAFDLPGDAITSASIGRRQPELLPWRYPLLSFLKTTLKRKRLPRRFGKNLTVLCAQYVKA